MFDLQNQRGSSLVKRQMTPDEKAFIVITILLLVFPPVGLPLMIWWTIKAERKLESDQQRRIDFPAVPKKRN